MLVRRVYTKSLFILILSSMITMLGALVDGIVIGKTLGDTAITAYGLALPMTVLITGISYAISSGGQALCGKAIGRGDQKEADSFFTNVMVWSVILGVLITILCTVLGDPITSLLGASRDNPEVFLQAKAYLLGYLPGSALIMLTMSLSSFMQLENDQARAIVAALLGTAANIAGDLLAVYVFKGGLFAVAMATTISYAVMVFVLLAHYFKKEHVLRFRPKEAGLKKCGEIFSLGLPSADIQVCSVFRSVFLNRLLLVIATNQAVAAFSIRMSMYNLYGSIVIGFGLATLLVGSFFIGEENRDALREMLGGALKQGILVTSIISALVFLAAGPFVTLYTSDPDVSSMAVSSIRWFALSLPLFVVNSVFSKYYQAMGRSGLSHLITIAENLVYVCLFALLLGSRFSVDGVWAAFVVTEAATLLTTFLIVSVKNHRPPKSLTNWMLLPEGFGAAPEDIYLREYHLLSEVSSASEGVTAFLRSHGESTAASNRLGLCTEELLKNSFVYGAARNHSVYLMLLSKPEEWVLCIRDTGKSFDPMEWLRSHEKAPDHIGLSLVKELSDDMTYLHTLKMNQISIRMKKESFASETLAPSRKNEGTS